MTKEGLYNAIEHSASYSVLLPILISLIRARALNRTLWVLLVYLILCFTVDQTYLSLLPDEAKANVVLNCWTVIECFFFCLLFFLEVTQKTTKIILSSVFFIFLIIAISIFSKDLSADDNKVSTIEAGLIIIFCVSYFF